LPTVRKTQNLELGLTPGLPPLVALAVAGRNLADITLPTQGSGGSSSEEGGDAVDGGSISGPTSDSTSMSGQTSTDSSSTCSATGDTNVQTLVINGPGGNIRSTSVTSTETCLPLQPAASAASTELGPLDDPQPAQGSHLVDGPSMRAAPSEGFIVGTFNNMKSAVVEFLTRDAQTELDESTNTWERLDAAKRNTLPNKLYHHVLVPIAGGVLDGADAAVGLLRHPIPTLTKVATGVYTLATDPGKVGANVYIQWEEFSKLSKTEQNDILLKFGSESVFLVAAGEFIAEIRGAEVPAKVAPNRKIALGLEGQLDGFANANSAESWKQFAKADPMQWKSYFLNVMNDPNAEVLFNLNGVDVWGGVTRASRGAGGATDWELLQIMQNEGWWSRIKWLKDGVPVPNPFE
jgi:hypothetical protein